MLCSVVVIRQVCLRATTIRSQLRSYYGGKLKGVPSREDASAALANWAAALHRVPAATQLPELRVNTDGSATAVGTPKISAGWGFVGLKQSGFPLKADFRKLTAQSPASDRTGPLCRGFTARSSNTGEITALNKGYAIIRPRPTSFSSAPTAPTPSIIKGTSPLPTGPRFQMALSSTALGSLLLAGYHIAFRKVKGHRKDMSLDSHINNYVDILA